MPQYPHCARLTRTLLYSTSESVVNVRFRYTSFGHPLPCMAGVLHWRSYALGLFGGSAGGRPLDARRRHEPYRQRFETGVVYQYLD